MDNKIEERLKKLENDLVYLREGHSNHLQRHNEEISELKDFVDLIFEMINNAGKDMENIESVLKELGDKLIGWQKEKQTDYDKSCFADSLSHTISKLDGEKEEIDPELMERIMSKKAEPMKKSSKYKCLDCNRIWNSLQLDQNNKGDLMCPICDCTGFDITEEKPSEPFDISLSEKGLDTVNRIIRESPEYKKLISEILEKLYHYKKINISPYCFLVRDAINKDIKEYEKKRAEK